MSARYECVEVCEEEGDRTILEFDMQYGTAYWPFGGNLLP